MEATFEEWVKAVFDHPVTSPEWYWNPDLDTFCTQLGINDNLAIEFMTRLFSAPRLLSIYSELQIAQGIWFLIGEASPGKSSYALLNSEIDLASRTNCVRSMAKFFCQFVAVIAPGKANTHSDPLHIACWMWWDILPTYIGDEREHELDDSRFETISEILALSSELCQLSALHGLNHLYASYPERVQEIIDTFLDQTDNLTPRVLDYAAMARSGAGQ